MVRDRFARFAHLHLLLPSDSTDERSPDPHPVWPGRWGLRYQFLLRTVVMASKRSQATRKQLSFEKEKGKTEP